MIVAATGHRPNKLGGYSHEVDARLRNLACWFLAAVRPDCAISGMALGWDMAIAEAAVTLQIPFIAAVPFVGQHTAWPLRSQERYTLLLEHAAQIEYVSSGGYSAGKMITRDRWMVDECTHVVALWDGSPDSGTGRTVEYANRRGRLGWNLWQYFR